MAGGSPDPVADHGPGWPGNRPDGLGQWQRNGFAWSAFPVRFRIDLVLQRVFRIKKTWGHSRKALDGIAGCAIIGNPGKDHPFDYSKLCQDHRWIPTVATG